MVVDDQPQPISRSSYIQEYHYNNWQSSSNAAHILEYNGIADGKYFSFDISSQIFEWIDTFSWVEEEAVTNTILIYFGEQGTMMTQSMVLLS